MRNGEEEHSVCELPMEPDVLIERKEAKLGSNPSHDRSAHGKEDKHAIDGENQTGTSRYPDGKGQHVQPRQARVGGLLPPVN